MSTCATNNILCTYIYVIYCACLIFLQNGEVQVFDAVNLKAVAVIPAHDTPLAALAFNSTGTKLASASSTVSCERAARGKGSRFLSLGSVW